MFQRFAGGEPAGATWPRKKIIAVLEKRFGHVEALAEDGSITVYGVSDEGVNFAVALVELTPGSGNVAEVGFLARFIGFPITPELIETINRNLHIANASLERGDLFLMAGMQVIGAFDETQFNLLIEAWRRDLRVCIHQLTASDTPMTEFFPAAKFAAARKFATNTAPAGEDGADPAAAADMFARFFGAERAARAACDACGGRGKRGLIARICDACDGTGFVTTRR